MVCVLESEKSEGARLSTAAALGSSAGSWVSILEASSRSAQVVECDWSQPPVVVGVQSRQLVRLLILLGGDPLNPHPCSEALEQTPNLRHQRLRSCL